MVLDLSKSIRAGNVWNIIKIFARVCFQFPTGELFVWADDRIVVGVYVSLTKYLLIKVKLGESLYFLL